MSRHPPKRRMPLLLSLSLIGFVCSGAAATAAWFIHRDAVRISAWPTTSGAVLISEIRPGSAETSDHRRQFAWLPLVRYRYEVGGVTYVSERVANRVYRDFGSPDSQPSAALRSLVGRYPAGAAVAIHYDPLSPASSVLEIDRTAASVLYYVSLVLGLAAIACLVARVSHP